MIYIALAILAILSLYNLMALKSIRKSIRETKDSIQSQVSWAKEDLRSATEDHQNRCSLAERSPQGSLQDFIQRGVQWLGFFFSLPAS